MTIHFNTAVCSGCRSCELVCSWANFKELNPKKSGIRIFDSEQPGHYKARLCTGCGTCVDLCPAGAISMENGKVEIAGSQCTGCLICVDNCPEKAIFVIPGQDVPFMCNSCGSCLEYCYPRALVKGGN